MGKALIVEMFLCTIVSVCLNIIKYLVVQIKSLKVLRSAHHYITCMCGWMYLWGGGGGGGAGGVEGGKINVCICQSKCHLRIYKHALVIY